MFDFVINKIVCGWVANCTITEDDKDIYVFGLDLILFSAFNLAFILTTALITGRLLESVVLIIVTVPLQTFGGGYHAKTHMNCFLIMYVGWWCVIWLAPHINSVALILLVLISVIIIFLLAPVAHENVPISEKQRNKMKILVRISTTAFAFLSLLLSVTGAGNQLIANLMALGLGAIAVSMLASKLQKKEN